MHVIESEHPQSYLIRHPKELAFLVLVHVPRVPRAGFFRSSLDIAGLSSVGL